MNTPDIDDLIDQLEEAQEAGRSLTPEQVCKECPELIEPLRQRWAAIHRFDDQFCTQAESTEEVQQKLAGMPGNMNGARLVMQTELHLQDFHASGGLGEVYEASDESLS
ncbi:MAG: hypothetical protein KDA45_14010, partial [Planctomycetales bacterium]|nr:hypothetical protein [Planctomycetales bacterium]